MVFQLKKIYKKKDFKIRQYFSKLFLNIDKKRHHRKDKLVILKANQLSSYSDRKDGCRTTAFCSLFSSFLGNEQMGIILIWIGKTEL